MKAFPMLLAVLLLAACSSNKELSLLHDDDVYYVPERPDKYDRPNNTEVTVTEVAFVDDATTKVDTSLNTDDYYNAHEYYNASVSGSVLRDTSSVARYYNTAYNTPRYYNYDRFRWNVGIGYSSYPYSTGLYYGNYGWGSSFGYGYSPYYGYGGYGGYGYGGYGGYYCPSIYNTGGYYPGGYTASYYGPRPNVGGSTGNGGGTTGSGNISYRNTYQRHNTSTGRNNFATAGAEPMDPKQPVYYSAERVRSMNSSRTSSGNSGFMNFIRETGRSMNNGGNNSYSEGRSNNSRTGNSYRPSGSRTTTPSRSFSAPRPSGGMRR